MANIFQLVRKAVSQAFAANPSERSLFFFQPTASKFNLTKIQNSQLRNILCDDEITAALDTRLDNMLSMPWKVAGGSEQDNLFMWDQIKKHHYSLICFTWWAVVFGRSGFQLVYEKEKSGVVLKSVHDEDYTNFTLANGQWMLNRKPIIEGKYVVTVNKPTALYPEGQGVAEKLFEIYNLRCHAWVYFMQYLEKFGVPFFSIKPGENTSKDDLDKMEAFLKAERPRGVVLPPGTEIDTIDGKTTSVAVFTEFEQIARERIQRLILGQTLTSGVSTTGSLALGEVHERVSWNKTHSDSKMIEKTINEVILYLWQLNQMKGDMPRFEFESPKGLQQDRANRDKTLSEIGVEFSEEYFVDEYDLDAEQIEYKAPEKTQSIFNSKFANRNSKEFINQETLKARASVAIKLEDKYIKDSPNFGAIINEIVKSAKSKKDLEKKLSSFLKKGTPEFDEALTEAMLKASVLGSENV